MIKHGANGFTLMEVMITVVIVGILAAIAYPSYTNYVTQARRSDSTINLTRIAALQEKFFTACGRYATGPASLGVAGTARNCAAPGTMDAGLAAGGVTSDGYYTLTTGVTANDGGYTLTATPTGTQATADITKCATLTVTATGVKAATGTDGNPTNGGKCWKK